MSLTDSIETEETDRLIASGKVEGATVYNEDGDKLGHIHNVLAEKISGQVE